MYIRRSEDVQDVFWTSYVSSIYVLCLQELCETCPHLEFFWSECGKIHTRKTPNTDTFHAVAALLKYVWPFSGHQALMGYILSWLSHFTTNNSLISLSKFIRQPYSLKQSLHKILRFHIISWCQNFMETQSYCRVSGDLPEILRKLRVSTEFLCQEIGWITVFYAVNSSSLSLSEYSLSLSYHYQSKKIRNIWEDVMHLI